MKKIFFLLYFLPLFAQIDVVMPVHDKDVESLDVVIDAILKNVEDVGRIIIISDKRYTERAEWVDERYFPFSLDDVGRELGGNGGVGENSRRSWYFQQLLKLYAFDIIEGLSDRILILDSDTRANHKTKFVDDEGKIFVDTVACGCAFQAYYIHMNKLLPDMKDTNLTVNPVVHHAVFAKEIIKDLFLKVERQFDVPFWVAFLNNVYVGEPLHIRRFYAGASEYMIYYHFCNNYHKDKIHQRNINLYEQAKNLTDYYSEEYYDFITSHKYRR